MRRLLWSGMNTAIHFDSQLVFDAKYVQDELLVRMLPPKL